MMKLLKYRYCMCFYLCGNLYQASTLNKIQKSILYFPFFFLFLYLFYHIIIIADITDVNVIFETKEMIGYWLHQINSKISHVHSYHREARVQSEVTSCRLVYFQSIYCPRLGCGCRLWPWSESSRV